MQIKLTPNRLASAAAMVCAALIATACGGSDDDTSTTATTTTNANDTALKFDAAGYTTVNVTVDGVATAVRQYRVVYVANPILMAATQSGFGGSTTLADRHAYQSMIISVPESAVNDQKAALYVSVNNAGWMASAVSTTITEGAAFTSTSDTDTAGAALKAGYVVVNVGTRSRGVRAEDGEWAGKAPAPVVDTKAAIRYLRLNDSLMAGSAERIVLHGTSGGGGLTAAVAASGNSADYLSYLADVGAAGISGSGASAVSTLKDDVFAAVAYCPINNLGNADAGYEWEYNSIRNNTNTGALNGVDYLSGPQPAASAEIAATFPGYVSGLNLTLEDGTALTTDNIKDATTKLLKAEIERQIAKGNVPPQLGDSFTITTSGMGGTSTKTVANDWLTLSGTGTSATVAAIDYAKFQNFVATITALKTVVAFDAVGVTGNASISGETNLFGSAAYQYANFTAWSWAHNAVANDGSGVDDTGLSWTQYLASSSNTLADQIKLINAVDYLNKSTADAAPYWYVRHGMIDRDTAFSVQTLLYYAIKNDTSVKDVNFALPYLTPHSGDYDVQEAFTWIKAKLDANP